MARLCSTTRASPTKALYADLRLHNPTATIWLTGHSLGGAVAALLGLTFGLPTVAFEAPPERLAVDRLGLGLPDEGDDKGEGWVNPVTNVFHTVRPLSSFPSPLLSEN